MQDHDQKPNHRLMLVQQLHQLKNYGYLTERNRPPLELDSSKFYLDNQARLFFNSTNGTTLHEGIYYLAFKVRIKSRISFFTAFFIF